MQKITSRDNQYLKLARSLTKKKGRMENRCFLAEGVRLCGEALLSGASVRFALLAEDGAAPAAALGEEAEQAGIPVFLLPRPLLEGVSATEHSQGIAFVMDMPQSICLPADGHCYAFCDGVADPGNMGTIFRSAYAAGVSGLILGPDSADPYNPKVVRSAMGAIFRMPFYRAVDEKDAFAAVDNLNLPVYASAMAGQDIRQTGDALRRPHIWVLGSEARGVSETWLKRADMKVSLPMREEAESLNVAVAAGVLFYLSFFAK